MLCPVCNGLQSIELACPQCGNAMQDDGKLSDWFGPYAPYVPHDEEEERPLLSAAHRSPDDVCSHVASCPACGCLREVTVTELGMR